MRLGLGCFYFLRFFFGFFWGGKGRERGREGERGGVEKGLRFNLGREKGGGGVFAGGLGMLGGYEMYRSFVLMIYFEKFGVSNFSYRFFRNEFWGEKMGFVIGFVSSLVQFELVCIVGLLLCKVRNGYISFSS